MTDREIYEKVFLELKKNPLFAGTNEDYSTKNGNKYFMYGIATVMKYIAQKAGRNYYADYEKAFIRSLIQAEEKERQETNG